MAYNTIADSDIDPESPLTTTLLTRLRDNPISIAAGDSGAPKIVTAAITDANVTTAKLESGEQMTTGNVRNATAGVSHNQIGAYAFLGTTSGTTVSQNATLSGSNLAAASDDGTQEAGSQSGTWRCMGYISAVNRATVWLRIS